MKNTFSYGTILSESGADFVVCPAFCDVHVHFREPGRPDKETILSGCRSAAAGGYTCVCPMPNLDPVPDTPAHLEKELEIIRRDAFIDVIPYASITLGRKGLEVVDVASLKGSVVAFSDDGSGVQDERVMRRAMETIARENCILAAHCEDNSLLWGGYIHDGAYAKAHGHRGICSESEWKQIERDLKLAGETGCAYHVCHVSTAQSIDVIRRAKDRGVDVTCETAPHYLVLCEDDLRDEGRFKMNPPLRAASDRAALIGALQDGTIDMIATDHAPHTAAEKSGGLEFSAMGVTGLETAFPVLNTFLVRKGVISLEKLIGLMSIAPRERFRLPVRPDDRVTLDLGAKWTIDSSKFFSKGHSTPFDGLEVFGKCKKTEYKGISIYDAE